MKKNLLVIEDNPDIAHLINVNLTTARMKLDLASDGTRGLELAVAEQYDLIILDLMLPGIDGVEICRTLRREKIYTPILMLTARTSELDRVLGLEVGADDYLTKPFSIQELSARVHAIIRRSDEYQVAESTRQEINSLVHGDLIINPERREVTVGEDVIDLTAKEFDLLWHFASHPGRVFTRSQLLDTVWGYGHAGYEHTVNSHINRLRAKIESDPARPHYVLTVWGVGYRFADSSLLAAAS